VELLAALITAPGPEAGLYLTNLRGKGPLDYPALRARREDLIMVSLIGTRRGEPAVDYTINPGLGFPLATGPAGLTEPVGHVLPAWDCIAGQMLVNTLLAAERHRLRTGAGQLAELALKDVAAAMLGHLGIIAEVTVNGQDRARHGNGQRLMVVGLTDRQWRGLVKVTGIGPALEAEGLALEGEGDRWHARDRITAHLAPWFAARPLPEVARLFDAAGLTWGPYRSFAGAVAEDPDLSAGNPMFDLVEQAGIGAYLAPGSPVAWSAFDRAPVVPAPRLGQHSEAILADVLGLGSGQIGALFDQGIVAGR
jgi:2-methylfumaryl-CoA isomerase